MGGEHMRVCHLEGADLHRLGRAAVATGRPHARARTKLGALTFHEEEESEREKDNLVALALEARSSGERLGH